MILCTCFTKLLTGFEFCFDRKVMRDGREKRYVRVKCENVKCLMFSFHKLSLEFKNEVKDRCDYEWILHKFSCVTFAWVLWVFKMEGSIYEYFYALPVCCCLVTGADQEAVVSNRTHHIE